MKKTTVNSTLSHYQVVDGRGSFSFDKKVILQLFKSSFQYVRDATILYKYGYSLEVNATFHEDLTGKVASGQGSVSFHEMDVKLQYAEFNPKNFKPGLPFKVLVSEFDNLATLAMPLIDEYLQIRTIIGC